VIARQFCCRAQVSGNSVARPGTAEIPKPQLFASISIIIASIRALYPLSTQPH
jgi:hypothetical protein